MQTWSNKACSLTYGSGLNYIHAQWFGYSTSLQLREMHEKLLDLMVQTNTFRVLGDNTNLPEIDPEDERWMNENWLPRAIDAGYHAAALLSSKSIGTQIVIDNIVRNAPAKSLTVKTFDDINKAKKWLENFQG